MKTTPTIESDIPLPDTRGEGPRSELAKALNSLAVGQSFLTPMQRGSIYSLARYHNIKISIRRDALTGGLRVWRTE